MEIKDKPFMPFTEGPLLAMPDLDALSDEEVIALFADLEPWPRYDPSRNAGGVALALPPQQERTTGGITIPDTVKRSAFMEEFQRGLLVVAVGPGVAWPEAGDRVHVIETAQKYRTTKPRGDKEGCHQYQAVVMDVLAIVDRVKR